MIKETMHAPTKEYKIISIIVLYHPERETVKQLISKLKQDNIPIVLIDNSPNSHYELFKAELNGTDKYQHSPNNIGLAKAQNIAIKKGLNEDYDFVLIFDQDSKIEPKSIRNLVDSFFEIRKTDANIAGVGCSYTDERFSSKQKYTVAQHQKKAMIISSGSLLSLDIIRDVGLMDENLFIDFIDTEWCYRAHKKGYSVYQSATAKMQHNLGESKAILGGLVKIRYSKPIRYYHFTKNLKRLTKENKISLKSMIGGYFYHLPTMLIKSLFLPNTMTYLKNLAKGLKS